MTPQKGGGAEEEDRAAWKGRKTHSAVASFQPRCLQVCPSEPSCEGSRLIFPIHPLPEPPDLRCPHPLLLSAGRSVRGSVAPGARQVPRASGPFPRCFWKSIDTLGGQSRHWRRPSLYNRLGLSKPPSLAPTPSPCLSQPCRPAVG